jgi:hypothetical protein
MGAGSSVFTGDPGAFVDVGARGVVGSAPVVSCCTLAVVIVCDPDSMGAGSSVCTGDPGAFVDVGARASITGVSGVAGAVKAPNHVAARRVGVAVMGPSGAFIHVSAGPAVSGIPRGARASGKAAIIVVLILVVTGFAAVGNSIPAGGGHASCSAGVRVGVGVGLAVIADLPRGGVEHPIPAGSRAAVDVAGAGLRAIVAGFSGVYHLVAAPGHAAISSAGVREGVGVVRSCVAGLPCFDLAVSADGGHTLPGVFIADKKVPAGGAGRGLLNRSLAGTEPQ